jgi:MFS family permease
MGLTFGAQIFGFAAASFADSIGAIPLLVLHSLIVFSGALISLKLKPAPPQPQDVNAGSRLNQIKSGLKVVIRSPRMGPALVMMMAMSTFYGGSFVVLNPIIVRDVYHGSASDISMSFAAFMIGTVVITILLVSLGGVKKQGRALMLAIFIGGIFLLIAATGLPFYGYLITLFFWGMCGGVAMSMGRTLMQESAPLEYRARVMSVFSLGSVGGMPMGALLMGYCAASIGGLMTLCVAVAGIWLVLALVWWKSALARLEPLTLEQHEPPLAK